MGISSDGIVFYGFLIEEESKNDKRLRELRGGDEDEGDYEKDTDDVVATLYGWEGRNESQEVRVVRYLPLRLNWRSMDRRMLVEVREIADGKISCECGNADWMQFLYLRGGTTQYAAGCKKCGSVYEYDGQNWVFKTKPEV